MIPNNYYSKVKPLMFLASSKISESQYRKVILLEANSPVKTKAPQIDGAPFDTDRFVQKFMDKLQDDDIKFTNEQNPIAREEVFNWFQRKFKAAESHVILVYSGHGRKEDGDWCAETKTQPLGDRFQLKQIINLWKTHKRNIEQSKLAIVMDSCYSGHWCCQLRDLYPQPNISIFASSEHFTKSKDISGGLFLRAILGTNAQFETNYRLFQEHDPIQRPVFISNSKTAAYFTKDQLRRIQQNIYLLFQISSEENSQNVYIGQSYQLGTYAGEKNIQNQRHGQGIMVYQNGNKYDGQWKNDQLHGTGILYIARINGKYSGTWVNNKLHGKGFMQLEGPHKKDMEYDHGRRIK